MQRAGGAPSSSPSTPSEPPIKRQRLSNGSVKSTHSSTPHHGAQQMPNALAGEEQKRTQVVNHEPADRGESRWYLSFKEPQAPSVDSPLRIVSAGYSMLDAAKDRSSEEEEESQASRQVKGRRSFGKFNRTLEKQQDSSVLSSDSGSSSEEDDEEVEDDSDDPTGAKRMIAQSRKDAGEKARAERKAKRKAEKVESARMADERRHKQVKLNKLTSISNAGGSTPSRTPSTKEMTCYRCGDKGHAQWECSQPQQKRRRDR